jgi:DNA-binding LacI/PurR family transcriptional regulator
LELPATLVDVAAEAGVSVATASRAINARPHVSPQTRERVLDAARRLRFQPSHAARTLRTRRANVIGLIVPDISSVFYAKALRAAEHTLRRQGYTLFITDTEEDGRLEWEAVNALLTHQVAGLILAPTGAAAGPLQRALRQRRVPVVVVDNRIDGLGVDAVLLDNVAGTRALTAHLLGHGHRRIAHLGGARPRDQRGGAPGRLPRGRRGGGAAFRPAADAAGRLDGGGGVSHDE